VNPNCRLITRIHVPPLSGLRNASGYASSDSERFCPGLRLSCTYQLFSTAVIRVCIHHWCSPRIAQDNFVFRPQYLAAGRWCPLIGCGNFNCVHCDPEFRSAPTCAFMPQYNCFPFFVWFISESCACSWFLIGLGTWMSVASTIVPLETRNPWALRWTWITSSNIAVSSCCFKRWRKFSIVVSSGRVSTTPKNHAKHHTLQFHTGCLPFAD